MRRRYQWGDQKPTHCFHGHEYTPDNTKTVTNTSTGREQRRCRTCERIAGRASYQRHRETRLAYGREYGRRYKAAKKRQTRSTL